MPTYSVFAPIGQLNDSQKADIARDITRTHNAVTGAQTFFAQVVFQDVAPGSWFMGGAPLQRDQVYVCGHVRGGRPKELKRQLILGLQEVVQRGAGVDKASVWIYLVELPPSLMVEYGYVLPEPGEEKAWLEGMPAADRAMLEAIGR